MKKRKVYRFTLDADLHKDLVDFIEAVPRVLRGGYCIEALRLLKENRTRYRLWLYKNGILR